MGLFTFLSVQLHLTIYQIDKYRNIDIVKFGVTISYFSIKRLGDFLHVFNNCLYYDSSIQNSGKGGLR